LLVLPLGLGVGACANGSAYPLAGRQQGRLSPGRTGMFRRTPVSTLTSLWGLGWLYLFPVAHLYRFVTVLASRYRDNVPENAV